MSSKRRLRRNACMGKVAHRKQVDALAAIRSLRMAGKSTEHLGAYRCPIREGPAHWHVGHNERADRAFIP